MRGKRVHNSSRPNGRRVSGRGHDQLAPVEDEQEGGPPKSWTGMEISDLYEQGSECERKR